MSDQMRSQLIGLASSSRSDQALFLKGIFDGLIYDGFRFPTSGTDGCIGRNCISKALVVWLPGATKPLGLHLNFMCVSGEFKAAKPSDGGSFVSTLQLKIGLFHLTARPLTDQHLINNAGPSILTAQNSIHIGPNGKWGRGDNIDRCAEAVGLEAGDLVQKLTTYEGYNGKYMATAAIQLKQAIIHTVGVNAGWTNISFDGSDSTFI